ncbi:MAG: hypothetical protein IPI49_12440 [Myxococcales bacterium]|nr:hypothetical protein [Myxococcales bacterium]
MYVATHGEATETGRALVLANGITLTAAMVVEQFGGRRAPGSGAQRLRHRAERFTGALG